MKQITKRFAGAIGALSFGVGAAACGSSTTNVATDDAARATDVVPTTEAASALTTTTSVPSVGPTSPQTKPSLASPLPAVAVLDVATGKRVQLRDFLPAKKPLLVWFWAPH